MRSEAAAEVPGRGKALTMTIRAVLQPLVWYNRGMGSNAMESMPVVTKRAEAGMLCSAYLGLGGPRRSGGLARWPCKRHAYRWRCATGMNCHAVHDPLMATCGYQQGRSKNALQCLHGAGRSEEEGGSLTVAMQAACLQVLVCDGNGLPCRA